MNKTILLVFFIIIILFITCKPVDSIINISNPTTLSDNKETDINNWHYKDYQTDSIVGISLEKAYFELLKKKKGKEIIIAVIDDKVDVNHQDLESQIWHNKKEIINNKDDDNNGYIDDINGWNYLGNQKGENIIYANFESTRIIRKYNPLFERETSDEFILNDSLMHKKYLIAKKEYKKEYEKASSSLKYAEKIVGNYYKAKEALKAYFPNEKYTLSKLNSIDTTNNNLSIHIKSIRRILEYDLTEEKMEHGINIRKRYFKYYLNLEYNEREIIGDNSNDLNDVDYGNNNVSSQVEILNHGTWVSGVLAASRNNKIGINGFSNNIKLMPLCVSAYGDESDKDIALAIRYAVNNGARIINMSSGKNLSMNTEWVTKALEYAAQNNVLFVSSAGNDNKDLDHDFLTYPSPKGNSGDGIEDVFILVGSSGSTLDQNLKARFSNYGKKNIDVFAPGVDIFTTNPGNDYVKKSGTSMAAPMVSGVAALIWSYYPKLKASQVKEIIMESGVLYDIDIEIKQEDGTTKLIPFSELSKSGKIVNAYNALLMAEQVSKEKK